MRKILVLIIILSLLCACTAAPQNPRAKTVTTVPGFADTALPREVVFTIDESANDILVAAAESFCRKANSLARGVFTLTLSKSADPLSDLKSGKTGAAFLDGDIAAAKLHPYFSITDERFRYNSYESFTMALNSARVLQSLSDVSGVDVFAAYYTGSNVFAGRASLDDALRAMIGEDNEANVKKANILTAPGSGTDSVFNIPSAMAMATEVLSTGERLEALYSDDKIAELSFEDLVPELILEAAPELPVHVNPQDEEEPIVITRSFHNITPMWLILEPSLYEKLPPLGQAAVDEAAAYLTGNIDGVYLRLEQERLTELMDMDFIISGDFTAIRAKILRARLELNGELTFGDRSFRELLDKIYI